MDLLLEAAMRSEDIIASSSNGASSHYPKPERITSSRDFAAVKPYFIGVSEISHASSMMVSLPPKKRVKHNHHCGDAMCKGRNGSWFSLASSRASVASSTSTSTSSLSQRSSHSPDAESSTPKEEWSTIHQPWRERRCPLELVRVTVPNERSHRQTTNRGGRVMSVVSNIPAKIPDRKRRASSSSVSRSSSPSSQQEVKDLNGNEMSIGYFSMGSHCCTISSEAEETETVGSTIAAYSRDPAENQGEVRLPNATGDEEEMSVYSTPFIANSNEKVSQSHQASASAVSYLAARELLQRAFLQALHQPSSTATEDCKRTN